MKPAGAGEERREQQFVTAQDTQRHPLRHGEFTAFALAH
jgi:hypothetical protein